MVTLQDIADAAHCSASTVSRALSGSPVVNEATRRRIEEIANSLGYRPNVVAQSLRRSENQNRMVGLIIPSVEEDNYTVGTALLHDALAQEGYHLVLSCHHNDVDADESAIRSLVERGVDAMVHVPSTRDMADIRRRLTRNIPVVELQRHSGAPDVDAVVTDVVLGTYDLTRHLVDRGHERIAMIAGFDLHTRSSARVEGFLRCIDEAQLSRDDCPCLVHVYDASWGRTATQALFDGTRRPPTAIVSGSIQISLGVLAELQYRGVTIPDDVSVVGLSEAAWCEIASPSLTTYEFPLREMGLMAAQMLLNRLHPQRSSLNPQVVRFGGRINERASVAKLSERVLG